MKPGDPFGGLTVHRLISGAEAGRNSKGNKKQGRHAWCDCVCGKSVLFSCNALRRGYAESCGCLPREELKPVAVGDRYGRLVVLKILSGKEVGRFTRQALCRCDCGSPEKMVGLCNLGRGGRTESCGCVLREARQRQAEARMPPPKPKPARAPYPPLSIDDFALARNGDW